MLHTSLILLALFYVAVTHYGFHQNSHSRYDANKRVEWSQPPLLDESFQTPISNSDWNVDFSKIEEIIWSSTASSSGQLLINAQTAEQLERAYHVLAENHSSRDLQRIAFLIEKSLPSPQGKQLASLFNQYYFYQQETKSWLSDIANAQGDKKRLLLQSSAQTISQWQADYFGEDTAQQLFTQKNTLTNYLHQRIIINLTQNLSAAQRSEKLSALADSHKQTILKNGIGFETANDR